MSPPRSSRRLKKDSPQKSFFPFEGQSGFFSLSKIQTKLFVSYSSTNLKNALVKMKLKIKTFFNWPWMWHCGPFLYLLFYFIATPQWRSNIKAYSWFFLYLSTIDPSDPLLPESRVRRSTQKSSKLQPAQTQKGQFLYFKILSS